MQYFPMRFLPSSKRHREDGIVLLSTLVSLALIISLLVVTQSMAVSNIKVISRLTAVEKDDLLEDSLRHLARPLIAEAMLDLNDTTTIQLNGKDYSFSLFDRVAILSVQNIEGLVSVTVSPEHVVRESLPEDLSEVVMRMKSDGLSSLPFRQRFAHAGGSLSKYPNLEMWITENASYSKLNSADRSVRFRTNGHQAPVDGNERQPQIVVLTVR